LSVPGWPHAVLFDLDGTLIDSAADLCAALNELLGRKGLGPISVDDAKGMIGRGVRMLVERAFVFAGRSLSETELDAEHKLMVDEIYGKHLTEFTTLLPDTRETLTTLKGQGRKLAVVTNKPDKFVLPVLDHFGLTPLLDVIIGADSGIAKKPAPDMLLAALERMEIAPADAVMVGDSVSDVASAHAAGVKTVLLEGGYTDVPAKDLGADAVIAGYRELEAAFRRIAP
jgi:phosphoglycolate phosphatase